MGIYTDLLKLYYMVAPLTALHALVDLDMDLSLVGFTGDDISAVLDELDVEKYFEKAPTPEQSNPEDSVGDENNEITCPHCGKMVNLAEL